MNEANRNELDVMLELEGRRGQARGGRAQCEWLKGRVDILEAALRAESEEPKP